MFMKYMAGLVFTLCMVMNYTMAVAVQTTPMSMHNYTSGDVNLAVHYHDSQKNAWITFGWISIPAYTSLRKNLPTDAKQLYFYAVNTNGKVYEGYKGNAWDKALSVSDEPFLIQEGEQPTQGSVSTRIFRVKRANKGAFSFKF